MPFTDELRRTIATLPRSPGVYLMRGADGEVLYIGKATDLRSRVRSYLGSGDPRPFVRLLDDLLSDVEVVVTNSAKEALLLENTLIKRHRPRFNLELRDDKQYVTLRIDPEHPWPRVEVVRRVREDGARYFGPYHSASKVRQTLQVLNRHFQLRTCRDAVLHNRTRPCLQYQIQRCPAPCVLPVDRDAYMDDVRHAMLFLEGRNDTLVDALRARMQEASDALEFEEAARIRDRIRAVEESREGQVAVRTSLTDQDVLGLAREGEDAMVVVLVLRAGSLIDMQRFPLTDQVVEDDALIEGFLSQYCMRPGAEWPPEILVPVLPRETEALDETLAERRGGRVRIAVPQRGEKRRLLELATENARTAFEDWRSVHRRGEEAVEKLRQRLRLRNAPRHMECYDISNFQGAEIVASQVVFVDGLPDRDRWRRYRIRSVSDQDDFGSLREVAVRRARAARSGDDPLPDLMVIDGGRGQLAAFLDGLRASGVEPPDVIGLAKARTIGTSDEDDATVHSSERVFLPGVREPLLLKPNTSERHLLERIRDEAHRFAITFHRKRRRSRTLHSGLDAIPGIGSGRRTALLRHFGSLRRVREAQLTELESVPGFSRKLAFSVYDHFHPGEADPPADGE
ncbi:MAG: excinuclease ABC subunit UvrC [Deltaproteobacteria bacterium]|nr:MAG: excinuclease ABC subunit UvrC [Deltaproteobacteria bacterium]